MLRVCLGLLIFLSMSLPAHAQRIGLYSGTFDPPHRGHLQLIQAAIEQLKLDRVYMLPNYSPTAKPGATPFAQRLLMTRLITLRDPRIRTLPAADFALAAGSPEYIPALIARIQALEGPQQIYYHLTGSDSFNKMAALGKLPSPQENRVVAVIPREGYPLDAGPAIDRARAAGRVVLLQVRIPAMSSSWIRTRLTQGDTAALATVLPPYLLDLILREGFYGVPPAVTDLRAVAVPAGYAERPLAHTASKSSPETSASPAPLEARSALLTPAAVELASSTLDAELTRCLPASLGELLKRQRVRLAFLLSPDDDPLTQASAQGFRLLRRFVPLRTQRPHYALAYKGPAAYLLVGLPLDQPPAELLDWARLLYRAGRPLADLALYLPPHFGGWVSAASAGPSALEAGSCRP